MGLERAAAEAEDRSEATARSFVQGDVTVGTGAAPASGYRSVTCMYMHTDSPLRTLFPPFEQLPEFQAEFLKERRKYHERQAKVEKLQQLQQLQQHRR